ncbi:hypothetical protein Lsed01_02281 [Demequina sediminis]|uniref:Uncharacterized protein n=1 Tax=Demequina sediminis TaxID=1930058 RepID=A0ABP9WLK5_9MICO|nr:hypothetical protein [Demequina sediminis]BDZ60590.1 hypothetical protein GCM10025873_03810 [Demequina sediminis]
MSAVVEQQRSKRRHLFAALVAVPTIVLMAVAVSWYWSVGWHRASSVCTTDAAVPAGVSGGSMDQAWSWVPLGFACTWPAGDGDDSFTIVKAWW